MHLLVLRDAFPAFLWLPLAAVVGALLRACVGSPAGSAEVAFVSGQGGPLRGGVDRPAPPGAALAPPPVRPPDPRPVACPAPDVASRLRWPEGAARLRDGLLSDPGQFRRVLSATAWPSCGSGERTTSQIWFWLAVCEAWAAQLGLAMAWEGQLGLHASGSGATFPFSEGQLRGLVGHLRKAVAAVARGVCPESELGTGHAPRPSPSPVRRLASVFSMAAGGTPASPVSRRPPVPASCSRGPAHPLLTPLYPPGAGAWDLGCTRPRDSAWLRAGPRPVSPPGVLPEVAGERPALAPVVDLGPLAVAAVAAGGAGPAVGAPVPVGTFGLRPRAAALPRGAAPPPAFPTAPLPGPSPPSSPVRGGLGIPPPPVSLV